MGAADVLSMLGSAAAGGVLVALIAWARERWRLRRPETIESINLRHTAEALASVTAAKEQLERDNERLRAQIREERTYYLGELERVRGQLLAALEEVDQLRTKVTREDEHR